ncbi:MAG: hypothetical protein LBI57_07745 [Helicobacteraceae bacterium]|jgi:5'-3' exonuclease|nr:hypothetical protein [Helicobacteraceae bacterium]
MVFLDFSSLFIQVAFGLKKRELMYSKNHLRTAFLSRLFALLKRFRRYGKLQILADSGKYWRAEIFAGYKKKRAVRRLQDDVDWDALHAAQDSIAAEMRENLPYALISVDGMEADDLIALSCRFHAPKNKRHLIISSDKDLTQLLREPNFSQWSVGKRSFLEYDPDAFKAHILRGDSSDSVPSIYFDDDRLIKSNGRRRLTDAKLKEVDISSVEKFRESYKNDPELERITANYRRNRALIDLRNIPYRFLPLFRKAAKEAQRNAKAAEANAETYLAKNNLLRKFQAIGERKEPNRPNGSKPRQTDQNCAKRRKEDFGDRKRRSFAPRRDLPPAQSDTKSES